MTAGSRRLLAGCFFVSGGTGLVYEVLWSRHLSLLFGSTTEAVSVVLAVFMAGLGAGAHVLGRRVDLSPSPMRLYGLLEVGIGAYALLTGPLLSLVRGAYLGLAGRVDLAPGSAALVKALLTALVLLPPAFLMGGTLPALVRAVSEDERTARLRVAILYGLNTLGAVAGTLAEGFVLLELLGLSRTMLVTALVNLGIGLVVVRRSREEAPSSPPASGDAEPLRASLRRLAAADGGGYLLVGLAVSGATTMAYEVVFVRVLGLFFGVSTQAFTIVLSVFLLGLGLGALAAAAIGRRRRATLAGFAASQLLVALLAAAAHALVPAVPRAVALLRQLPEPSYESLLLGKALLAGSLLLPLALAAGLGVPLLLETLAGDVARLGRSVGAAYLTNTAGTVAGSLLAGFLLVPWLGTGGTLRAVVAVNAAVALAGLARGALTRGELLRRAGAAVAACLAVVLLPRWPERLFLFSDSAVPPGVAQSRLGLERRVTAFPQEVVWLREGRNATVAVTRTPVSRVLLVSGHPDGSDGRDMSTQLLLGALPFLVHPGPRDVLVVGFGTGVTAGTALRSGGVGRVTVAEIERAVLQAGPLFAHVNGGALSDPRLRPVVDDARSHVLGTRERYDLVVSEPSNPWRAGVASLFTREFFEGTRRVLRPGGVLAQWVQLYNLEPGSLRMILRTIGAAFPELSVWWLDPLNVVVLASDAPLVVDRERLDRFVTLFGDDARRHAGARSAEEVLARWLLDTRGVRAFAGEGELHTDDLPLLEFDAARGFFSADGRNAARLLSARLASGPPGPPVAGGSVSPGRLRIGLARLCRDAGLRREAAEELRLSAEEGETARATAARAELSLLDGDLAGAGSALAELELTEGVPPDAAREAALIRARLSLGTDAFTVSLEALSKASPLSGAEERERLGTLVLAGRTADAVALGRSLLSRARLGGDVGPGEVSFVHEQLLALAARGEPPLPLAELVATTPPPSAGFAQQPRLKTLALLLERGGRGDQALPPALECLETGVVDPEAMALAARLLRSASRGREASAIEARHRTLVPRSASEPLAAPAPTR